MNSPTAVKALGADYIFKPVSTGPFKVAEFVEPADLRDKSYRELHISLNAVRREEDLESLRDILFASSGQCSVTLHVPTAAGGATVKAHSGITCAASDEVLERLRETPVVAELWLD